MKVGDGARNTNYDYTGGDLDELIDIICEEKAKLFVCAIGAPPKKIVDKLHANKIVVMNMVGSVRNCEKALERGVDLICAQGTEAGGHTGDISTLCLVPQCVDLCKNKKSFFGGDVHVVGAGGIYDGRGVAAVMALGAVGAWIGTRFVCATESSAPPHHKKKIIAANSSVPIRTLTLSGRPIRLIPNKWVLETEKDKAKLDEMLREGTIPAYAAIGSDNKKLVHVLEAANSLAGQACGGIKDIKPAAQIVQSLVEECVAVFKGFGGGRSRM